MASAKFVSLSVEMIGFPNPSASFNLMFLCNIELQDLNYVSGMDCY